MSGAGVSLGGAVRPSLRTLGSAGTGFGTCASVPKDPERASKRNAKAARTATGKDMAREGARPREAAANRRALVSAIALGAGEKRAFDPPIEVSRAPRCG